ncbi:MAG: DUF2064 domain-containing protein, partial [Pseudomonadota bacterium]
VKTRLGRDVGTVAATWWFRHQVSHLLRKVRDPRWRVVLAVAPDTALTRCRVWPNDLAWLPQGPGDLGDRMARLIRNAPSGPVLIVGADIPGITPARISRAFQALGSASSVVGPAPDGGYWLVGLKRTAAVPKNLFQGVRWSTEHALYDTKRTLPHPVAEIDHLRDVDTLADLTHLRRRRIS